MLSSHMNKRSNEIYNNGKRDVVEYAFGLCTNNATKNVT